MLKKKKKLIIGIIIAILLVGACEAKKYYSKPKEQVNTMEVKKSKLDLVTEYSGNVLSEKEVSVFIDSVQTVKTLNYRVGDFVKKDDVIIEFKNDSNDTNKDSYEKLRLQYESAHKNYEANKQIFAVGGISKDELDKSLLNLKIAKLDYESARKKQLKKKDKILAPVSGVITSLKADVNYKVDPSEPLFKIADTENLKIILEVPNSVAKKLGVGSEVSIKSDSLESNEVLQGKITSKSNISYKSKVTGDIVTEVIIKLDNNSTLKPGDKVDAIIKYDSIDGIIIPYNYINDNAVYVINKDGKTEKRDVTIGKTDGLNYEIKTGLNAGETITDKIQGDKAK